MPDLGPRLANRAVSIVSCFRYAETLTSDGLVYFPAQYARALAEHAPVLWINPPGRRPRLPRRVGKVLVVDTLGAQAEIGRWRGAPLTQATVVLRAFVRAHRRKALLLLHFSTVFPAGTRLPPARRAAFLGDSFFPLDDPYLRECDLLVCSSQAHAERVRATSGLPPALQLSMGVTEAFLARAAGAARTGRAPALFARPERPIVAYFGRLARADVALIAGLARRLPDVNVLLAGTLGDRRPELELPNVRFLDRYGNDEMPELLADVDCGLIAYAIDEFNLGASPTKLFEYFALGLPVVSTPLSYPPDLGSLVRIATDADEAAREVSSALGAPGDPAPRHAAATASTPEHRLTALLRQLDDDERRLGAEFGPRA